MSGRRPTEDQYEFDRVVRHLVRLHHQQGEEVVERVCRFSQNGRADAPR